MKNIKKITGLLNPIISVFLAVLLSLSPIFVYGSGAGQENTQLDGGIETPTFVYKAEDQQDVDQKDDNQLDGSQESPMVKLGESGSDKKDLIVVEISTEAELRGLANRVNNGDNMKGYLVKLMQNININENELWVPIGNSALAPFSGSFDGQGFEISGIKVDPEVNGGLFGYLLDAKIKNITIISFKAVKSTGGLFYSAVGTSIDMSRTEQGGANAVFAAFRSTRALSTWAGGMDKTWHNTLLPETEYRITTAEELAGLADFVTNDWEDFSGITIVLESDFDMSAGGWTPIGTSVFNSWSPFSGTFIGNNCNVIGLDDALFGGTLDALITGVNIIDSDINSGGADVGVGALVNHADCTQISQIHIKGTTIKGLVPVSYGFEGVGGAIGSFTSMMSSKPSVASQILVENTNVEGDVSVGGVIGSADVPAISECVAYDVTLNNTVGGLIGGIVGEFANVSSGMGGALKDCLVVKADMGSTAFAGIAHTGLQTNNISDAIVSDITTTYSGADAFVGVGDGIYGYISGVQNVFTDSDLNIGFVPDNTETAIDVDGVMGIYWDSIADHQNAPISGVGGNLGMSTNFLTDGDWSPNPANWVATDLFYPQLKSLATKTWNDSVPYISAIAATALSTVNSDENYVNGAGQIVLPSFIEIDGEGSASVNWSGYQSFVPSQLKVLNTPKGIVLSAVSSGVSIPQITAEINGYTKDFRNIKISDTTLNYSHSKPAANDIVEAETDKFIAYFDEPIDFNPLAAGKMVELQTIRTGGPVTVEVISLDPAEAGLKMEIGTDPATGKGTVTFKLAELQPGNKYQMVIPEDAFIQAGNDKALSQFIEVAFDTMAIGKPVITFVKDLIFPVSHDIIVADLISNIVVKDFNGSVMYNGAAPSGGTATISEYTGSLWNPSDIEKSQTDITSAMGINEVYYLISDKTILSATDREAGVYEIYVFAKNAKGRTSTRTMTLVTKGFPEWKVQPEPIVHMQWTDNKNSVMDAAKQNALAEIKQKNGNSTPCVVTVEFTENDWEKSAFFKDGPTTIRAEVVATDPSGTTELREPVLVFLDKPLFWTNTPSPVTMHLTTQAQVEKRIDLIGRNFDKKIVEYEHWDNDYRKPGKYYVDITSDKQFVTSCDMESSDMESCKYNHPAERVSEIFIVNVVDTPGYVITTSWGMAAADLLRYSQANNDFESGYVYSKNIVRLNPTNHLMPSFVPEALLHQAYGRMEVNYNLYRWNFYSNTLDTRYMWSDEYNLEANIGAASGSEDAVQIKFNHDGRLFGAVEFDINLDEAKAIAPNLPNKDLGLYRYDGVAGKLVLVSNVIVEEGKWASSLIDEIYPTTYVLKSKGTKEVIGENSLENLNKFYMDTKEFKNGIVSDGDPKLVNLPNSDKEFKKLYYAEAEETTSSNKNIITISVLALIVAIGVVAALLYLRKRREEK